MMNQTSPVEYLEKFQMYEANDVVVLFVSLIFIVCVVSLISMVINFTPQFISTWLNKNENRSIQEQDPPIPLDQREFKSMHFKWGGKNGK